MKAEKTFIDATHIKANANRIKHRGERQQRQRGYYDGQLWEEINAGRGTHGKKTMHDKDDGDMLSSGTIEINLSTMDPEHGLFHKGERKVAFACTAHAACDENNFILSCEVTPNNLHDSMVFDRVRKRR